VTNSIFNRWIVLFWGLCISFILLILIPGEQFVFRLVSVTLIAVFSLCHYLYKRYSKRLTLQADLMIRINTLMQFLLPVFFLAPYYSANPGMDLWVHRYGFAIWRDADDFILKLLGCFFGNSKNIPEWYTTAYWDMAKLSG
jgi:hypothetical protein